MKKTITIITAILLSVAATAQTPAFPGAEGHGRYTTGGRGGKIVHVTNLNDSGTGSFRQAVSGSEKKIVVFDVGGVIALNSDVNIGANTTIEGQTAPSPGITLRYYTVNPAGNNIIMRFIRIRRGEERDVNDGADASTARHLNNIIIDHCSMSWSIDEVASFYDNNNFTMQWCTIGESLNNAGHNKGAHGYGGIWGGKLASFHHNLILHVNNRSPRFNGARYDWQGFTGNSQYTKYKWQNAVQAENVDFRNCVVYNCGNGCYGGPGGGQINMVGNYYKSGPAGSTTQLTTVTVGASGNAEGYPIYWGMTSRYFLDGNLIDNNSVGWQQVTYDNGTITHDGKRYSKDPNHYYGDDVDYYTNNNTDYVCLQLDDPIATDSVTTHTAAMAYEKVVAYAGASLNRDNVDERYADETLNGTATYRGSTTKKAGRIDKVSDVEGYTEQNFGTGSRPNGYDTDGDGMPDDWEYENGLDPEKNDANAYTLDTLQHYTNIEVYCNSIVQTIMRKENADAETEVMDYFPAYFNTNGAKIPAINVPKPKTPDDPETPEADVIGTGTISWPMNATTLSAGNVSEEISNYVSAAIPTVGSNLTIDKVRSGVGLDFKAKAKESRAAESNAIVFSITTAEGYLFTPTKVQLSIQREGTDSGTADVAWISDITYPILSNFAPDREKVSKIEEAVANAIAFEGESKLKVNIYSLNAGKSTAMGNVIITGNITKPEEQDPDTPKQGDVNGDNAVNVGDIMAVINYMAGSTGNIDKAKADVNNDGAVNVGDIMAIINIMATQ